MWRGSPLPPRLTCSSLRRAPMPLPRSPARNFAAPNTSAAPIKDKGGNLKQRPEETLFAKIVSGQIPAKKVHEDERALAFHDINPQAPVHVLVIPKKPIGGVSDAVSADEAILGHLFLVASEVARKLNVEQDGYRLVINEGKNGQQSVRWLHVHLLAGRQLTWPPG